MEEHEEPCRGAEEVDGLHQCGHACHQETCSQEMQEVHHHHHVDTLQCDTAEMRQDRKVCTRAATLESVQVSFCFALHCMYTLSELYNDCKGSICTLGRFTVC